MTPVHIGIPRALAYYAYYPLWRAFFEELGMVVVRSDPTTKVTLDAGVAETVNDACIPIKLFHGHVSNLKNKVDCIFVPRLVSVRKFETETFCPKFLGLPELLRASIADLPDMIDIRVDLARGRQELFRVCLQLGKKFGAGFWKTCRAYLKARQFFNRYKRLLLEGLLPAEALECLDQGKTPAPTRDKHLTLAVLGYPYAVYDRFVNVDLIRKLRTMGVKVVTAEMVPPHLLRREAGKPPKNMFWYFSNRTIHATSYFLNKKNVDGIVHVTAFACGPDAMVDRLMSMDARQYGEMPFLSVTIDEHTGEGGIQTRLEAFVDMLKRRKGLS